MTKTMIIEYQERDENVLLEIFRRFNVKNRFKNADEPVLSEEAKWVKKQLHLKYVETGLWYKMDDDARERATLSELMLWNDENNSDYLTDGETDLLLVKLQNGTYGTHH